MKYHFHFKASSFPLVLTELCWNEKGYGMFEYWILQEKDLMIGYCSDLGVTEQYVYGKENLFDEQKRVEVFQKIDTYDAKLVALELPKKGEGLIATEERSYWLEVYEKIRPYFRELGQVYFIMEPMTLSALAEFVTKICERDGLNQDEVLGNVSVATNFSPQEEKLVQALRQLGEKKLSIHTHIEPPLRTLYELLNFIATQLQIPLAHTEVMKDAEILKFLKEEAAPNADLETRSKGVVLISKNKIITIEDGAKYKKWKNILEPPYTGEIRGTVAFRGKVVGPAVIHLSWIDTTSIPKGSVLVTGMTNPQMLPYIKDASAIVTDEGGLTCHAAIISREMKIPCIVGTKVGTQVIKDGDLLEVDAIRGTVKVLTI